MSDRPRLLFLIRSNNTGGTYTAFSQVKALNRLGFNAAAVYVGKDDVSSEPDLPVVRGLQSIALAPMDVVVIDEGFRDAFDKLGSINVRKILFNQAVFYGWYFGFETPDELNAYPLDAVITASRYATDLLLTFGVKKPIHTVFPTLDERFRPEKKALRIAYNGAKRSFESRFVKTLFGARHPKWKNVPWLPLVNMTRDSCAEVMNGSFIYASFAHLESLGLMSLEAMTAHTLVAGFDGGGGKEYATQDNGRWIAEGDYTGLTDALADLCEAYAAPERVAAQVAAGEETASQFNEERFVASLLQCWNTILGAQVMLYRASALNP